MQQITRTTTVYLGDDGKEYETQEVCWQADAVYWKMQFNSLMDVSREQINRDKLIEQVADLKDELNS